MTKKETVATLVPAENDQATQEQDFDFTVPQSSMNAETDFVFRQLRRLAQVRNDNSILPNGRKMTRKEVETILGQEINLQDQTTKCCA